MSTGITKTGLIFSPVRKFRSRCFRVRHITCLTAKIESAEELSNLWDLRLICFDLLQVAPGRNAGFATILPGVNWCICTRAREKKHLSTGLLDLGRMDGSLIISEPSFTQCPPFSQQTEGAFECAQCGSVSIEQRKRLERVSRSSPAWRSALASKRGQWKMSEQPAAGLKPRNSCKGITQGRSRWTLLKNKTKRPILRVCMLLQRGDVSRGKSKGSNLIYRGSWKKFRAPDPEPSSAQAIFLEGPL